MKLSDEDIILLRQLSKAINRTAYHGGLGLKESGKYLGLLDRIAQAQGVNLEDVPYERPADTVEYTPHPFDQALRGDSK